MGRLNPKKEPTFGKRKPSWGFGKPKGKIASKQDDVNDVVIPDDIKEIVVRTSRKTTRTFSDKMKEVERYSLSIGRKNNKAKKNELIISEFMSWMHNKFENMSCKYDAHHWNPASAIRRNDFFITMLPHDEHMYIHSHGTVKGFVESKGEENLLRNSKKQFNEWVESLPTEHKEKENLMMLSNELNRSESVNECVNITREYANNKRY